MFDPDTLYRADDPKLLSIASYSTFAHMRGEGRGPVYLKLGRVMYRGSDLNDWLETIAVRPTRDTKGGKYKPADQGVYE